MRQKKFKKLEAELSNETYMKIELLSSLGVKVISQIEPTKIKIQTES